jgi:hypothetical protein
MHSISLARANSSLPPRANSPASAGVFYSCLANPFAGLGERPDDHSPSIPSCPTAELLPPLDDCAPVDISRVDLMAWVRQLADEVITQRGASC